MQLLEKYNESLDRTSSRFESLLSTHTEKIKRAITNVILTIVILLVFGCLDFVNWTFDFGKIITGEYWARVISKIIAAICAFNIGINFNWDTVMERAIDLKENIKLYEVLLKQKDDEHFDYYVNHIFNKRIKRRAYINQINKKIYKLNKFSKDSDKALYSQKIPENAENYEQLCKELEEKKATNKYCVRRAELEYLKSDEYIKDNIDSLAVKYSRVDPSVFNLEIDAKVRNEQIKVKGNIGLRKAKASSSIIMSMVAISMFTTSLVISLNQEQFVDQMTAFWYYLCTCLTDAAIIAWNVFRGTASVKGIISDELTQPYANRNRVLKGFIEYVETNNLQPSKSHLKIQKLIDENEGIVEMSKEEYEKTLLNS